MNDVRKISLTSLTQTAHAHGLVTLRDDVALVVDDALRVHAEVATVHFKDKILEIQGASPVPSSIETPYFLMLADTLWFDLTSATGVAYNIRVHVDGRFLRARRGRRIDGVTWELEDVLFSACDAPVAHWAFSAQRVTLKNYLIFLHDLTIHIGGKRLLTLPYFLFPLLPHSRTGFLLPKFSIDRSFGLGITIPYHFECIPDVLDLTAGLHWRQKRGIAFFSDIRHTVHQDSFSRAYFLYAHDRSKLPQAYGNVGRHRYWFEGVFVAPLTFDSMLFRTLFHFDFGTDKYIPYDFFNKPALVEDFFWNVGIVRWQDRYQQAFLYGDHYEVLRRRFTCSQSQVHAVDEHNRLTHLPHVQYTQTYRDVGGPFSYQAMTFADRVFVHHDADCCSSSHDTFRWHAQADVRYQQRFAFGTCTARCTPTVQVQSKLLDTSCINAAGYYVAGSLPLEGGCRMFLQSEVSLALPPLRGYNPQGSYLHRLQPYITMRARPQLQQANWLHADEHDCIYPQTSLLGGFESSWLLDDIFFRIDTAIGYEWADMQAVFPLRVSSVHTHALPIRIAVEGAYKEGFSFSLHQEYHGKNFSLLQLEMDLACFYKQWSLNVGWVHQSRGTQQSRGLLSDIPSFVHMTTGCALEEKFSCMYTASFALKGARPSSFFAHVDVLLQRLRIDYNGHCWGVSFSFEEKRFSQRGQVKKEQLYCFSFRLQSLGVLAKYFKNKPTILKAPDCF